MPRPLFSMILAAARVPTAALAVAFTLAFILVGNGAFAQVRIDRLEQKKWLAEGQLTFYVDVTEEGRAIKAADVDKDGVKLFVDDKPIPGTYAIRPFSETTEPVSVTIILAAHDDYQPIEADGEETFGNESAFEKGLAGMVSFVQSLGQDNKVSLWCYGESPGFREVSGFRNAGNAAADEFKRLADGACRKMQQKVGEGDQAAKVSSAPDLYGPFKQKMQDKLGKDLSTEAGRRIILLMSDGLDRNARDATSDEKIGADITAITTEANNIGARIYTIGYDTLTGDYFRFLNRLAADTGGVPQMLDAMSAHSTQDIQSMWGNTADRLLNQLVITFKPTDLRGGGKVRFGMEVVSGGKTFRGPSTGAITLQERSFDWINLVKWIGIGLGGVFIVVLLFILILRRIQNPRPKEVVIRQEVNMEPGGPARGRLLATQGPRAGETFYLTEEVTTIGRMDGNHIVIDDPSVSKRHAGIRVKDLRFELADLGAANGVLVNGRQITKQFLRDGDTIRIGDTEMVFHLK